MCSMDTFTPNSPQTDGSKAPAAASINKGEHRSSEQGGEKKYFFLDFKNVFFSTKQKLKKKLIISCTFVTPFATFDNIFRYFKDIILRQFSIHSCGNLSLVIPNNKTLEH